MTFLSNFKSIIASKKGKRERLNRRIHALLKKVYEVAELCDINTALILCYHKTGHYLTYKSPNRLEHFFQSSL